MEEKFKIASQNVGNKVTSKLYDGYYKPFVLADNIKDVDVLCLQEVNPRYLIKLMFCLQNRTCIGEFRYGEELSSFKKEWAQYFNEACPIISKDEPTDFETYWLSETPDKLGSKSFCSFLPRVATVACYGQLAVVNLHLDHVLRYTKRKQLEVVLNIVKKLKEYQVVVTGDFNLGENDALMAFAFGLKKLGIELLEQENDTFFKFNKSAKLDHIFASKELACEPVRTVDLGISDHHMIYTKTRYNPKH